MIEGLTREKKMKRELVSAWNEKKAMKKKGAKVGEARGLRNRMLRLMEVYGVAALSGFLSQSGSWKSTGES